MNEENIEEGFAPDLSPETFSFFDVLSEKAYPKDTVDVYLDDVAAYELRKLTAEANAIEGEPDQATIDSFAERLADLRKRINDSKTTFYLTGVGADRIKDAMTLADAKFENRKINRKLASGAIERVLPQSEQVNYMRYVSAIMLSLHVEKVVDAKGRQNVAPGPDELVAFLDTAPPYAVREVNQAIERLQVDARDFEAQLDDGFFPTS